MLIRRLIASISLGLTLVACGAATNIAAPTNTPVLAGAQPTQTPARNVPACCAPVTIKPLISTLPDPAQRNTCVDNAVKYTDVSYSVGTTPTTVVFARHVTDAQLAQVAPHYAEYHFGVLMNLVVLKGNFRVPRSVYGLPYIIYILTPYPDCSPTVTAFDVRDFALPALPTTVAP